MAYDETRSYNLPYDNVIWEVEQAMVACKFNLEVVDQARGFLRAKTSMSMASYGETIEVSVGRQGSVVTVLATSRPSHYFTDMGKSKTNVRHLFTYLDGRMAGYIVQGGVGPPQAGPAYGAGAAHGGGPAFTVKMAEPGRVAPVLLTVVNGFITLIIAFVYMTIWPPVGIILLLFAVLSFLGAGLMGANQWKAGAVFAIIGGVITVPIGILGIIGGSKAWQYGKWLALTRSAGQ